MEIWQGEKYLYGEVLVNLDSSSENENVLHKICELPCITEPFQHAFFGSWLRRLHFLSPAFAGYHGVQFTAFAEVSNRLRSVVAGADRRSRTIDAGKAP